MKIIEYVKTETEARECLEPGDLDIKIMEPREKDLAILQAYHLERIAENLERIAYSLEYIDKHLNQ